MFRRGAHLDKVTGFVIPFETCCLIAQDVRRFIGFVGNRYALHPDCSSVTSYGYGYSYKFGY